MPPPPPPLQVLSATIQVTRLAGAVGAQLRDVIVENRRLKECIKNALVALMKELELVESNLPGSNDRYLGPAQEVRIVQLQDVLHDVELFLEGLWEPGLRGYVLLCLGCDPRLVDLDRIHHFRERIKAIREFKPAEGGEANAETGVSSLYTPEAELVGIAESKSDILQFMSPEAGELELRVITLVGCRGVGKTALARAVYDHSGATSNYDSVAWVVASGCVDHNSLHQRILQALQKAPGPIATAISGILSGKRYLVVIDDLHVGHLWQDIKKVFPENRNCSSVIVTTSVMCIASSCRGHIVSVHPLSSAHSRKLFWEKVEICPSRALADATENLFDKCDGLPLALISVANHLLEQGKVNLKVRDCRQEALALGRHLAGPDTTNCFQVMRKALAQSYGGLPDHIHRLCLLALAMFPKGHQVKVKSLVRVLIAGGLIVGDDVRLDKENIALSCVEELVNQNIIKPVVVGTDYKVKRCQVDGLVQEFLVHKSAYQNFATLLHNDVCIPKFRSSSHVRRLSIYGGTEQSEKVVEKISLSDAIWIRVSNTRAFVDLKACKVLQVLDLEGCIGIDDSVMKDICHLKFLKYLGLRGAYVTMIPKSINKLNHLQTLDIRETNIKVVPTEILKLPQLAYIFGKFEPPKPSGKARATLEQLHTLSGVVISGDWRAFNHIMLCAGTRLKKLKIWCEAPPLHCCSSFKDRLQERFTGTATLDCLTIDSAHLCQEFISFLHHPCGIRSLKLIGALDNLPEPALLRELGALQELYLISAGLTCDMLSVLQILPCLVYLKLSEPTGFRGHSSFVSQSYGFWSLQRVCFEAPKLPQVLIAPGGMKCLASIDLLCPEYSPMPDFPTPFVMTDAEKRIECWAGFSGISHLDHLKELTLHPATDETKMQRWKELSILHKNKPCVKRHST